MGNVISWTIEHIAPLFLISSPITSYVDQILSIQRTRTSAGFSLDIPLIMLLASILKVFYWLGARYDTALLIQALLMIGMQTALLSVALQHRAPSSVQHTPFSSVTSLTPITLLSGTAPRPYSFWQWASQKPFWLVLAYYTVGLFVLQIIFGTWFHSAPTAFYTTLQSIIALSIEALLPIPQILTNQQTRSCKGFRLSVLANWLIGDAFKMVFFFYKDSGDVPWAFKVCGIFQACCDVYLGVQYWLFGDGEVSAPWGGSGKTYGRGQRHAPGVGFEEQPWMPGPGTTMGDLKGELR